jgi:toxin HigB-1
LSYQPWADTISAMELRYADRRLERLEMDAGFTAGFDRSIVRAFRSRVQFIRAAPDERVFYAMKSLHYEKLAGKRSHQRSMRLNDQFRLILEVEQWPRKRIVVVSVEDYH